MVFWSLRARAFFLSLEDLLVLFIQIALEIISLPKQLKKKKIPFIVFSDNTNLVYYVY